MAKTKQPIMETSPQDLLKSFVKQVGTLIDARIRTAEVTIKAEIKDTKNGLRAEIRATEERLTKKIDTISQRLDRHEERMKKLEEQVDLVIDLTPAQ